MDDYQIKTNKFSSYKNEKNISQDHGEQNIPIFQRIRVDIDFQPIEINAPQSVIIGTYERTNACTHVTLLPLTFSFLRFISFFFLIFFLFSLLWFLVLLLLFFLFFSLLLFFNIFFQFNFFVSLCRFDSKIFSSWRHHNQIDWFASVQRYVTLLVFYDTV